MVAFAVHGRREPEADRPHALVDVVERKVLGAAAQGVGTVRRRRVVLGGRASEHKSGDAGGQEERAVRAGQRVADRLDRDAFGAVRLGGVAPVVLVGEVDDGLGVGRACAQAVEVVEVAA